MDKETIAKDYRQIWNNSTKMIELLYDNCVLSQKHAMDWDTQHDRLLQWCTVKMIQPRRSGKSYTLASFVKTRKLKTLVLSPTLRMSTSTARLGGNEFKLVTSTIQGFSITDQEIENEAFDVVIVDEYEFITCQQLANLYKFASKMAYTNKNRFKKPFVLFMVGSANNA